TRRDRLNVRSSRPSACESRDPRRSYPVGSGSSTACSRLARDDRLRGMTHFIDRRLNPKSKSLANRQRFLRRARSQIREAAQKSLKDSVVEDIGKDRKVKISTKGTKEPRFRLDPRASGERDFVLPGNREFMPGDEIKKPPKSEDGQSGKQAADSGEG